MRYHFWLRFNFWVRFCLSNSKFLLHFINCLFVTIRIYFFQLLFSFYFLLGDFDYLKSHFISQLSSQTKLSFYFQKTSQNTFWNKMLLESKPDGENESLIKCHSRGMGNKLGKELTVNLVMNVLRWCCDERNNYF